MDYEPITKELRKDFDLCTRTDGIAPNEFETVWITKSVAVAALDNIDDIHRSLEQENERLRNASERDDWLAEHEDAMVEHGWVKLPTDADGVPIHIGDMLAEDGASPERVKSLMLDCDGWNVNFGLGWCVSKYHKWHHVTPDTWERIISDAMRAGRAEVTVDVDVMPLIKRCKALCERTRESDYDE